MMMMIPVDTARGRRVGDEELKESIAGEHPYRAWLDEYMVRLEDLPAALRMSPYRLSSSGRRIPADMVLIARGFLGPESSLPLALGVGLAQGRATARDVDAFLMGESVLP